MNRMCKSVRVELNAKRNRSLASLALLALVCCCLLGGQAFAGRSGPLLGGGKPRTLQMIGATNPRMLHRISADLQPDTSKVVHIQVPYYIDRPKVRTKKFKPWIPRGHRFVTAMGGPGQSHPVGTVSFGGASFPLRDTPAAPKPVITSELLLGASVGGSNSPGPYDTPFVPVMKPSPVNPLHGEQHPPEILFEPISILPLAPPSFATLRNHVNFLKQKQAAFFEGQGREFGSWGAPGAGELEYFGEHDTDLGTAVHNGDVGRQEGDRNTLSEDDFGQNDRKYDRRGKVPAASAEEQSAEADFYDSEGKQFRDDDFEDSSREEADRVAAFEPKKVYTQVRHREVVRHVPREEAHDDDDDEREEDDHEKERHHGTTEGEEEDDEEEEEGEVEGKGQGDHDGEDTDEDGEDDDEVQDRHRYRSKGSDRRRPMIKERVKLHRKNIVYSEKGHEADKFDHGSEEAFGAFEENEAEAKPGRKKAKRNRIKRSKAGNDGERGANQTSSVVDVLAWMILGNATNLTSLPQPEALTDPRELHGEELLRFLDEAIQNTTQYLPESTSRGGGAGDVISIVSPPSNVVKFPYYNRPAAEIDVDSALRYAENLTTFSTGLYGNKAAAKGIECNEVDVELEDEPEPVGGGEGAEADGFRPIKRLQGLGDKIDCLKARHFGREPLDNPLFREEFVGGVGPGRTVAAGKVPTPAHPQPNPAVAVYNDVIRHIKKHLASQARRKNSKSDEQDPGLMIAVPRVLRLDADEESSEHRFRLDGGRRREPRLAFPQANPFPVSNHISVPIFDISKYVPRFMMRGNDDLFAEDDDDDVDLAPRRPPPPVVEPVKPRLNTPKVRLQTLVKTAEQLAEGAVSVEEGVERHLTTERPVRDDIADAFDDVLAKRPNSPAPLPPIRQYSVVEQDAKDGPEAPFNKSGPPYAALALEPPVAQSILKQRIAPLERNQLDFLKGKRSTKIPAVTRKSRRPTVSRKKVLVFYH